MDDSCKSSPLLLGRLLHVAGDPTPRISLTLNAEGLKAHTAFIAQSGSGKSFGLGRLLEEILCKTRVRILILDPNSDFVQFSEVARERWTDDKFKGEFDLSDTADAFTNAWHTKEFRIATAREVSDLGLSHQRALAVPISLSWGRLVPSEIATYLGFSIAQHTREIHALDTVWRNARDLWSDSSKPFSLRHFVAVAAAVRAKAAKLKGKVPSGWPVKEVTVGPDISAEAAFEVWARASAQPSSPW